jgi:probable HAF family extracellular repeat protein
MKTNSLIVIMFAALMITSQAQAEYFRGLPGVDGLSGSYEQALAVSTDGTLEGAVVVGMSAYGAARWTFRTVGVFEFWIAERLEAFPYPLRNAFDVAGNGETVVGVQERTGYDFEAFRWTEAGGAENLVPDMTGYENSCAFGTNQDGLVVVGSISSMLPEDYPELSFRWTEAAGMEILGTIGGQDGESSMAYEVSAEGDVVVGVDRGKIRQAFRWTDRGGMIGLGFLPDHEASEARDVSEDGKVVVGTSQGSTRAGDVEEAFYWTLKEGMRGLGDLRGGSFESRAYGVNGDGSVVVGVGNSEAGDEAVFWNKGRLYNLRKYLYPKVTTIDFRGRKFNPLKGWTLTAAYDVSADGKTIVGFGTNPDGEMQAWIANIGEVGASGLLSPSGLRVVPSP